MATVLEMLDWLKEHDDPTAEPEPDFGELLAENTFGTSGSIAPGNNPDL